MFDFVQKRKRAVRVIMVIATLPFLFWGIDSYRNPSGEDYVAVVSGEKIHRQEFDQALRTQQEISCNRFYIKPLDPAQAA